MPEIGPAGFISEEEWLLSTVFTITDGNRDAEDSGIFSYLHREISVKFWCEPLHTTVFLLKILLQ